MERLPERVLHHLIGMARDLKSLIQADVKNTFMALDGFAHQETIRYYRNGQRNPPDEFRIPVITESDANMNAAWNKNKAQQRAGNDQDLFQMDLVLWVAQEDFQPAPKKKRDIALMGKLYNIIDVDTQDGMFKLELRILEE